MATSCGKSTLVTNHLSSLPEPHYLEVAVKVTYFSCQQKTLTVAYPLISSILAHIAVLPTSSAQVERLYSAMKRIKSAQRNSLKTITLDNLL